MRRKKRDCKKNVEAEGNKISVIIPIYNAEKYLIECLNSVINQTYGNLEIILVNDGSSDGSLKICNEYAAYDARIRVISKENGGVSSARNAGLDIATGEWLYFIDSDDWIELNTLEKVLNMAIETNTDICFFDYEKVYKNKRVPISTFRSDKNIFCQMDSYETLYLYSQSPYIWNCIIKRISEINNIQYEKKLYIGEDDIFKFQIYRYIKSFSYLNETLYHYRMRNTSAIHSVKKDYLENVYIKYTIMKNIIQNGGYTKLALRIPDSMLIGKLSAIVTIAFYGRIGIKCDYRLIESFMNSSEYRQAIENYDKRLIQGRANKIYIKIKKPNRLLFTVVYFSINIWNLLFHGKNELY